MSGPKHDRPYGDSSGWWGPAWVRPRPLTLLDLVATGTLQIDIAAFLWAAITRRSSLIVVAGPSGAGKTTLLSAVADLLPVEERRIHVRGVYDPFAFLSDPAVEPSVSSLMVNEISPHLPIYLWGPGVRRLLRATERGFRVLATAHATSCQELIAQLAAYPLRIPMAELAALDLVVVLHAWREGTKILRRIAEVNVLKPSDRAGLVPTPLLTGQPSRLDLDAAGLWLDRRFGHKPDGRRDVDDRVRVIERVLAETRGSALDDQDVSERLNAKLSRCQSHT